MSDFEYDSYDVSTLKVAFQNLRKAEQEGFWLGVVGGFPLALWLVTQKRLQHKVAAGPVTKGLSCLIFGSLMQLRRLHLPGQAVLQRRRGAGQPQVLPPPQQGHHLQLIPNQIISPLPITTTPHLILINYMSQDLDQSLAGESEFIYLKDPLDQSLIATSEKVFFQNASLINQAELEKAKKQLKQLKQVAEEPLEETQNEFLEVGKWRKGKESVQFKEMAEVKKEVQEIMTKTTSKKEKKAKVEEQEIADESICVEEEPEKEEAIEDQTQQEQSEGQQQEQQEEEQEQEEEEQQEEEEEEEEEEQQQEQQQEQEQSQQPSEEAEQGERGEDDDDKTDAQSQMKRTEYLPSKWTRKSGSQGPSNPSQNSWGRKQEILQRLLILLK